jgi:hypothetical protein
MVDLVGHCGHLILSQVVAFVSGRILRQKGSFANVGPNILEPMLLNKLGRKSFELGMAVLSQGILLHRSCSCRRRTGARLESLFLLLFGSLAGRRVGGHGTDRKCSPVISLPSEVYVHSAVPGSSGSGAASGVMTLTQSSEIQYKPWTEREANGDLPAWDMEQIHEL